MGLIEQQRPGQFVRVATEAVQDPQPAYAQPGRRRRRQPAPAEPALQPQQQEDASAIHRLEARVARIEDQLEWIGEVLLQIASAQGQQTRPFPARAHDHEAGPSRPPGVVSDKCGVTVPPPLVLTTGVFTVAPQLQHAKIEDRFVRNLYL
ncbi:hypothetical protein L2E82_25156 [Cichorium intybus]|uniref:Uncharacterized protein n=1 Tax=Cichorium intybus TaxID=13427 RepID=A0ACB9E316_CICIN|nr:hypothetical protein L2E82_25156 [Cichorium intybus]